MNAASPDRGRARAAVSSAGVFRPVASAVAFWVVVGLAVVLLGDAALAAAWRVFWLALPPTLLVLWAFWLLLWRPCIRWDAVGLEVVNVGRVHAIPWARVVGVARRYSIVFRLDDGTSLSAWASPVPSRRALRSAASRGGHAPADPAEVLDAARIAAATSSSPRSRRLDLGALSVGAVLLAAVLVELALR